MILSMKLFATLIATAFAAAPSFAETAPAPLQVEAEVPTDTAEDGLVRLPGQGERRKPKQLMERNTPERFVDGGGLILSFDTNGDAVITPSEIEMGISAAFLDADECADGDLTALEQQAGAKRLPTRDDTLANPVRFDPNLDRVVSEAEFSATIYQIAAPYADANGMITVDALKAPPERPERAEAIRPDRRQLQPGRSRFPLQRNT